jgi:hypothetical protein
MENLNEGLHVHYVQPDGTHSTATITQVHNKDAGVVDLSITPDNDNQEPYNRSTVVYSKNPREDTWHFIEDDTPE